VFLINIVVYIRIQFLHNHIHNCISEG